MTKDKTKGAYAEELHEGSMCYKPRDLRNKNSYRLCTKCNTNKHRNSFPSGQGQDPKNWICKVCI